MNHSKAKLAFMRKLYLSYLIQQHTPSLPQLQELSGMPRRTLQDCIGSLSDIGVECIFEQQEGARNNAGSYRITDWGPVQSAWVQQHLNELEQLLGIASQQ